MLKIFEKGHCMQEAYKMCRNLALLLAIIFHPSCKQNVKGNFRSYSIEYGFRDFWAML